MNCTVFSCHRKMECVGSGGRAAFIIFCLMNDYGL